MSSLVLHSTTVLFHANLYTCPPLVHLSAIILFHNNFYTCPAWYISQQLYFSMKIFSLHLLVQLVTLHDSYTFPQQFLHLQTCPAWYILRQFFSKTIFTPVQLGIFHLNLKKYANILQEIKGFKVQIKTIPFFQSRSLFLFTLAVATKTTLFSKREKSGKHWRRRRKRRNLAMKSPLHSRLKKQSSLREQLQFILFFC